jgi:hypothetical protein
MSEAKTPKPKTAREELDELKAADEERSARIQLEAAKSGGKGYTLPLFEPIMIGSEKRDSLHFRAQTIRDIREGKGDDEITAALCNITIEQLMQLSSIDYAATQDVLAGFHLRRAGSAQKG